MSWTMLTRMRRLFGFRKVLFRTFDGLISSSAIIFHPERAFVRPSWPDNHSI